MKYIKITISIIIILIAGMYGWYLFATVINKHADQAAALIIEDTFTSINSHDISVLRDIKENVINGESENAILLIDEAIKGKLYLLELCLTDLCEEITYDDYKK